MKLYNKHYVAVIGGSISGSEAANLLAQKGFRVVVFEMNKLPYGKIEDGLPNWHVKLRNRQQGEIDNKLDQENIRYVPSTKIGRDINFNDLVVNWGFSAVILANGAWMDRLLPIEGINKYINNGLIYQNDFIYWFNHKHEPNYKGKNYSIMDDGVVIGGGLSSLDVVKVVMIELVKKSLKNNFEIDVDLLTLEKAGIDKVLNTYNIAFDKLGINGVKLVYRRKAEDMPLKSPKDSTKEGKLKARAVSKKLLERYKEKYHFQFLPERVPCGFISDENGLNGIKLQRVKAINGKIESIPGAIETLSTKMIISSIGSVPEPIDGLEYHGYSLKMKGDGDYHVQGFDNVFAIGNAVTGRGNIIESKQHGRKMTERIINKHLTQDALEEWLENYNSIIKSNVSESIDRIVEEINKKELQPDEIIQKIIDRTTVLQNSSDYENYKEWIKKHKPIRLEELL